MSIPHLNAAWSARIEDPQAKLVLVRLADMAKKETGLCWPSLDELASDTELHRSTVSRKIDTLEKLGWLSRKRKKNGCDYTINIAPGKSHGATSQANQEVAHSDLTSRTQRLSKEGGKSHTATSQVAPCNLESRTQRLAYTKEPKGTQREPKEREKSAPAQKTFEEWSDQMPTETARDFAKLEAWINSLHPSWKKRPHLTRIEREELMANSKIFFDLTDRDKALLARYMDAAIEESWGKFWQPDQRGQLVRSVMDVLGHADRWERECRKRKVATGLEVAGGVA